MPMEDKTIRLNTRLDERNGDILLHFTSSKINHDHHKPQQTPTVADPQSGSVPRRLLCNRLEVLIHLTLLRVTCGAGSRRGETASESVRQPTSPVVTQLVSWSVTKGTFFRVDVCP